MGDGVHRLMISPIQFVVPGILAGSPRPGYPSGSFERPIAKAIVDAWIERAKTGGIRSIICLLADEHLQCYRDLGEELPSYYRRQGFEVAHIPVGDHRQPPLDTATLVRIGDAYAMLPKPVLVHCSAGVDRTGAALRYLQSRFNLARLANEAGDR